MCVCVRCVPLLLLLSVVCHVAGDDMNTVQDYPEEHVVFITRKTTRFLKLLPVHAGNQQKIVSALWGLLRPPYYNGAGGITHYASVSLFSSHVWWLLGGLSTRGGFSFMCIFYWCIKKTLNGNRKINLNITEGFYGGGGHICGSFAKHNIPQIWIQQKMGSRNEVPPGINNLLS